jgi:hypothetical protein
VQAYVDGENELLVLGFRPDGTHDPSWGTNGIGRYEDRLGTTDIRCGRLAERPDGEVFLLMSKLALLTSEGAVDESFGDHGIVAPPAAEALLLQPRRRVIVAGGVQSPRQHRGVAVVRYRY